MQYLCTLFCTANTFPKKKNCVVSLSSRLEKFLINACFLPYLTLPYLASPYLASPYHVLSSRSQMDQDQMINDSIRTIAETEEIGGVIIGELQRNSETIKSSHNKVSCSLALARLSTEIIVYCILYLFPFMWYCHILTRV